MIQTKCNRVRIASKQPIIKTDYQTVGDYDFPSKITSFDCGGQGCRLSSNQFMISQGIAPIVSKDQFQGMNTSERV